MGFRLVDNRVVPDLWGDLNFDNVVDSSDLGLLLNNFGGSGIGDINANGSVNSEDPGMLLNHFSFTTSSPSAVPELDFPCGLLVMASCPILCAELTRFNRSRNAPAAEQSDDQSRA